MKDKIEIIKDIENQIEQALRNFELHDMLPQALDAYQEAEVKLMEVEPAADKLIKAEQQRVLSYCLMRQGNILRQLGKPGEALALGEREMDAARACGDGITLARALMSNATNLIVSGSLAPGLQQLEEARQLFEQGQSYDHQQGLGWYWILQADLANAGLVEKAPREVIEMANHALDILLPIENWPGVAHAYGSRAKAHEKLGDEMAAQEDLRQQETYEKRFNATI